MMAQESLNPTSLQQLNIDKNYNLFGYLPNANGASIRVWFSEKKGDEKGNYIFIALGATREQVITCLIALVDRREIREALAEEIQQMFETNEFISTEEWEDLLEERTKKAGEYNNFIAKVCDDFPAWQPTLGQGRDARERNLINYIKQQNSASPVIKQIESRGKALTNAEKAIKLYFQREDVVKAYTTALRKRRLPLGYKSVLLYAKHQGINLYIWQKKPDHPEQLRLLHHHADASNKKIHILNTKGYTHFSLLNEGPSAHLEDISEQKQENAVSKFPAPMPVSAQITRELHEEEKKEEASAVPLELFGIVNEDDRNAEAFFEHLLDQKGSFAGLRKDMLSAHNIVFVTVSHVVRSLPLFINAIKKIAPIAAIIPKGSSRREYQEKIPFYKKMQEVYGDLLKDNLNREVLAKPENTTAFFEEIRRNYPNHKIIIIDEGGYFVPFVKYIMTKTPTNSWLRTCISSINEITKNGHLRYLKLFDEVSGESCLLDFPISSIAESSIKKKEDVEVGAAIVGDLGTALRADANTSVRLSTLSILGCGVIGKSVASAAQYETLAPIQIYDRSSAEAEKLRRKLKNQVKVHKSKETLLTGARILVSATGMNALTAEDLAQLPEGAIIACVTSRDDELHAEALLEYERVGEGFPVQYIAQYRHKKTHKSINLVLDGNAVNFLTNSVVGPGIYAVLASTLVCAFRAYDRTTRLKLNRLNVLSEEDIHTIEKVHESIYGRYHVKTKMFGLYTSINRFIGREKELTQLRETLQREERYTGERYSRGFVISGQSERVVGESISGLGGVGKSKLAREYAKQCMDDDYYSYIIIFDATDALTLAKHFRDLAKQLGLLIEAKQDTASVVQSVYRALLSYPRILIIYDNVEDYAVLSGKPIITAANVSKPPSDGPCFLPPENPKYTVHWIATTRNHGFSDVHPTIYLGGFTPEDARAYIFDSLQLKNSEANQRDVDSLAKRLHFFPLALSQAVAYIIRHEHITIIDYLELYEGLAASLHNDVPRGSEYTRSLYITWWLSWRALQEAGDTDALKLLEYCAYLASKNIPEFLLAALLQKDIASVNLTLEKLSNYSLIDRQPTNCCVNVHELVQEIIRLHIQAPLRPMNHTPISEIFSQTLEILDGFVLHSADDQLDANVVQSIRALEPHIATFVQHYEEKKYLPVQLLNNSRLFQLLFNLGKFQFFALYAVEEASKNLSKCGSLMETSNLHLSSDVQNSLQNTLMFIEWHKDPTRFLEFRGTNKTLFTRHVEIFLLAISKQFDKAETEIGKLLTDLHDDMHSHIATEALKAWSFVYQEKYTEQRNLLRDVLKKIEIFEEKYHEPFNDRVVIQVLLGLAIAESMLGHEEEGLDYLRHLWIRLYKTQLLKTHLNVLKNLIQQSPAQAPPCVNLVYLMLAGAYQALGDRDSAEECTYNYQALRDDIPLPPGYENRYLFFAVPRSGICLVPEGSPASVVEEAGEERKDDESVDPTRRQNPYDLRASVMSVEVAAVPHEPQLHGGRFEAFEANVDFAKTLSVVTSRQEALHHFIAITNGQGIPYKKAQSHLDELIKVSDDISSEYTRLNKIAMR